MVMLNSGRPIKKHLSASIERASSMTDPFSTTDTGPVGIKSTLTAIVVGLKFWRFFRKGWVKLSEQRIQTALRSLNYVEAPATPRRKPLRPQVGVLAFKRTALGVQVLLVTTMKRRKWIVPKGNVGKGRSHIEAARDEVREEAGVEGILIGDPLGKYQYSSKNGVRREVTVYAMEVVQEHSEWEEDGYRQRRWWNLSDAIFVVEHDGLRRLLFEFRSRINSEGWPVVGVVVNKSKQEI
jgi:8-oxo-dGTP pyrophosphatase MutT (NUDIX family)